MFCLPLLTSIPFKLVKAILFLFLIPISLANIHHANKSALNILKVLRVTTSNTITIQLSVMWMPKIKHKQSDIISRTEVLFYTMLKIITLPVGDTAWHVTTWKYRKLLANTHTGKKPVENFEGWRKRPFLVSLLRVWNGKMIKSGQFSGSTSKCSNCTKKEPNDFVKLFHQFKSTLDQFHVKN